MIINTHAHEDHGGANGEFPGQVEIVAHDRAKARLGRESIRSFADRLTLLEGSNRIELYYFGRGHTDGDVVVVFPEKRVAYVGDLFPAKAVPVIDTARGGSGLAYPETLARAAAALTGVTRVITGHGPPVQGSPIVRGLPALRDLQEYAEFMKDFVAAVQAARQAGKSAADAAATLALPERYKAYDMSNAPATVRAIYDELSSR
jgi:glyoxylase-like metal-dependent hydrolase (beta-lactamase superfamily II)